MARALRIMFPGALYHVTSRGNERNDVFKKGTERNFLNTLNHPTNVTMQSSMPSVRWITCLMLSSTGDWSSTPGRSRAFPSPAAGGQSLEKILPVFVILENRSAFDSSNDDMVQRAGCIDSGFAGHAFQTQLS